MELLPAILKFHIVLIKCTKAIKEWYIVPLIMNLKESEMRNDRNQKVILAKTSVDFYFIVYEYVWISILIEVYSAVIQR